MNNLAAVIVETRPDKLQKAIVNHFPFLPMGTTCYIFGGNDIYAFLFNRVHVRYDNVTPSFINLSNHVNESYYNTLLTTKIFWNTFQEENILIFQHDSELLREGIEEFYEWNYVGSPWKFMPHGGNGGLSLRKKSAMLKVIEKVPYRGESIHGNEDVYFCNQLKALKMNLAPREVCKKFSCETIAEFGTLGIHSIDKWHSKEICEQIRNQYKKVEA